jgi:uncharacterized membrane protein
MDASEKWLVRKEVAARWSVSVDTVSRRIRAGLLKALKLPSITRGKRRYECFRISLAEVVRFERLYMTQ